MPQIHRIESIQKIVVRVPNWLGDLVMATPILSDLRQAFPKCHLAVLAQGNVAPLLKDDPRIDELIIMHRFKGQENGVERRRIIALLQQKQFDLGVLLTNSLSSAWIFYRGHVKQRLGFKNGLRSLLLTTAVANPPFIEQQHLVLTYKELLKPLGIAPSATKPELYVSAEEAQWAHSFLGEVAIYAQHKIVAINPGAAYGSAKCWLPDRFQKLTAQLLEDPKVRIVYLGDKNGASLVHQICHPFSQKVYNLAGKTTLRQLVALLKQVDVLVTNDSGPMHIASALGTPLVALFGSTSAQKTGPYNGGVVIDKQVACSPCYKRQCPIDFKCMKQIEVLEVLMAVERELNR